MRATASAIMLTNLCAIYRTLLLPTSLRNNSPSPALNGTRSCYHTIHRQLTGSNGMRSSLETED
ncbi:hypothetical protein PF008_g15741 [Phytophthora fragariae]|uniref:RxLR effector protein n=1 Tax=Phytophthora fragariae TaxID=53985 RepID=A0A6G0RDN8_9STRA|nr:hypothetical protein PF008_g15741 [Phytophthora fragariae]